VVKPAEPRCRLVALAGFLIATGTGAAATLEWQSYGGTARRLIARLSPQLGWLAKPAPADPGAPFTRFSRSARSDFAQSRPGAAEPGQAHLRYRQIASGQAGHTPISMSAGARSQAWETKEAVWKTRARLEESLREA
jgi:hypothetical protein